ncbi:hypothetical protein GJ496_009619 [Pomphorhynchus laevis]|nr:hypothetical protein GJ496_009619 [Pomphorhynchus laevis]
MACKRSLQCDNGLNADNVTEPCLKITRVDDQLEPLTNEVKSSSNNHTEYSQTRKIADEHMRDTNTGDCLLKKAKRRRHARKRCRCKKVGNSHELKKEDSAKQDLDKQLNDPSTTPETQTYQQKNRDNYCSICLDEINCENGQMYGLLENCEHMFCFTCLERWRHGKDFEPEFLRKCPVCKKASWYHIPCREILSGTERDRFIIHFLIEHPKQNIFFPFILWDKK